MLHARRAIVLQLAAVLLAVVAIIICSRYFAVIDAIAAAQRYVMKQGVWSAIWYPLLYACCNVLLLPAGVLSVGGGFFFGLWWGFAIVLVGNVTGAAIAFFISRLLGQRWLRARLQRNSVFWALQPALEHEGWKIILLSQLHPLFPTSLLNYLYGLTQIRFRTCMLWVAIGQAPGLFLYAYLGTLGQLGLNLLRGRTHPRLVEYVVWIGGFASVAVVSIVLGRVSLRLLQQAQRASRRDDVDSGQTHYDKPLAVNE